MTAFRLIARLDVKDADVVKGVQYEGLRRLGRAADFARAYYEDGIDEILYIDTAASINGFGAMLEVIRETSMDVFVPMTAGGGIKSVEDAKAVLRAGADKVAVNTAAVNNALLLSELAKAFGRQAVVLNLEVGADGMVLTDYGREATALPAVKWARQAVEYGAGEILVSDVSRDGTGRGVNVELVQRIAEAVEVPVVAGSGYAGEIVKFPCNGLAVGSALHYCAEYGGCLAHPLGLPIPRGVVPLSVGAIKRRLRQKGHEVVEHRGGAE